MAIIMMIIIRIMISDGYGARGGCWTYVVLLGALRRCAERECDRVL